MPELPEVETVVRDLRPHLSGRSFGAVHAGKKALRKPWRPAWSVKLVGRIVEAVRRRGKWIVIDLRDGGHLVVHLGMTGQFRVFDAGSALANHTHLIFRLDDERELRFRDVRRFGSATLFAAQSDLDSFFEKAKLGPGAVRPRRRDMARRSGEDGPLSQGRVAGPARRGWCRKHLRGRGFI